MKLSNLVIKNFRNFESCQIEFDSAINFFMGSNGFGKTSILESISVLSHLKSFRSSSLSECIKHGCTEAEVVAQLGELDTQIKVSIFEKGKQAFINQKAFKNTVAFFKQRFGNFEMGFHAIVFSPDDHRLVKGEPQNRRSYLDSVISAESPRYLELLSRYKKCLEQRNRLLQTNIRSVENQNILDVFTDDLINLGSEITHHRISWVFSISDGFSERLKRIASTQARCEIFYNFSGNPTSYFSGHSAVPSLDEIRGALKNKVRLEADREWVLGQTRVGPHRDDLGIGIPGQLLKSMGSQGEIRSALLALKFSEIDHFKEVTGHSPVLLLDDLSSELDASRREELLKYLVYSELQVFVTTTEEQNIYGKKFYFEKSGVLNVA